MAKKQEKKAAKHPSARIDILSEIAKERARQISKEGYEPEHDDAHDQGELAQAASCYALTPIFREARPTIMANIWPFPELLKSKGRRRDLIIAAALIIAEIERLDRVEKNKEAA